MKYFSMFSGIGGFELGLENSDYDFECVGYSEIDKYADSIYRKNFPGHKGYGDATKLDPRDLPDFDLLVGGFPCQAFSVAGHRRGFDDTRGTLFFEIARVLRDKRPRYFLLENVRGLLSHDKGETFQIILEILADLGYYVKWKVYNSKNYGVPQNRERLFIEGYSRDRCGPEVLFKQGEGGEASKRVNAPYNKSRTVNVVNPDGLCGTLTGVGQKSGGRTLIKLNKRPQAQTIYDVDGIACCLSANGGGDGDYIVKNEEEYQVRRLTPLETERLQAFPDNWTATGCNGEKISDTQRYKCCGNAVTTSVITYIINSMFSDQ